MKQNIKILVEKLFDDLYDIEDNKNLDIEISDEYLTYTVGDMQIKYGHS